MNKKKKLSKRKKSKCGRWRWGESKGKENSLQRHSHHLKKYKFQPTADNFFSAA